MAQAAATGAFDFSRFDPANRMSRLHLNIICETVHRNLIAEVTTANILRTAAIASGANAESFRSLSDASHEYLKTLLELKCPWRITETVSDVDLLVKAYHDEYGRPGEARYDAMIAKTNAQLKARRRNGSTRHNN